VTGDGEAVAADPTDRGATTCTRRCITRRAGVDGRRMDRNSAARFQLESRESETPASPDVAATASVARAAVCVLTPAGAPSILPTTATPQAKAASPPTITETPRLPNGGRRTHPAPRIDSRARAYTTRPAPPRDAIRGRRTRLGGAGANPTPSAASGPRNTSWIEAEPSPQKSSGPTGAVTDDSATSVREARGPNGTSSSFGPNQSRGSWTTLLGGAPASLPSPPCRPSLSTRLQTFFVRRDDVVLLAQ
jgi:hypothetical protein